MLAINSKNLYAFEIIPCSVCSVEVSLVTHHFPFDEILQFVMVCDHVLIVLDLHISFDYSQVYSSKINLPRVFLVAMPNECEVSTQILCSLLDVMLRSRLVVQEAELESCLSLGFI